MKYDMNKVKSSSAEELNDLLLPVIEEIYREYDYVNIEKDAYLTMIKNAIVESRKIAPKSDTMEFEAVFSKQLRYFMNQHIKGLLLNPAMFSMVVSGFVNKNVHLSNIKDFKKVIDFFEELEFPITSDLCMMLLQSDKQIRNMVKSIAEVNPNDFEDNEIDDILENHICESFIEAYFLMYNIRGEDNEDASKPDKITYESIRNNLKMYLMSLDEPILSIDEEKELAYRVSQGDNAAKKRFIESNLKLVVSIAKLYRNRGIPFMDLIQEGNLGLIRAVERFDVSRGIKFSTYATILIRQAITNAIPRQARAIHIPFYIYEKISQYRKEEALFREEYDRYPTIKELAKRMSVSEDEASWLCSLQKGMVSMNTIVGDDDDCELGDFVVDRGKMPEDIVNESILKDSVHELLKNCNLTEKETIILTLRYGLDGGQMQTLEEISQGFGVTRERIRQIEAKALGKIRRSRYIDEFAIYMQYPERARENIEEYKKIKTMGR